MSEYCKSNFERELVDRMRENLEDVQRAEIRWISRLNYNDFASVTDLCRNMRFLLNGFEGNKKE